MTLKKIKRALRIIATVAAVALVVIERLESEAQLGGKHAERLD